MKLAILQLFTLISLLGLTACTTQWTKLGFNLEQWRKDNADCIAQAARAFPAQYSTYQLPGYTAPVRTNCYATGSLVNCTTTGGQSYPITVSNDLNEGNRNNAWEACIRAQGYYPVHENHAAPASLPATPNSTNGSDSANSPLDEDYACQQESRLGPHAKYNYYSNTCVCQSDYWLFNGRCEPTTKYCAKVYGQEAAAGSPGQLTACKCHPGPCKCSLLKDKDDMTPCL